MKIIYPSSTFSMTIIMILSAFSNLIHFCRCSYHYDPLGNLYRKNCSDMTSFQYLVDPFGPFGADTIAEVYRKTNYNILFVLCSSVK